MKLTTYDTPLNEGRPAKVVLNDELEDKPKRRTLVVIAEEYGIHPHAIVTFRKRHPEIAHWSADQVAAQVALNKNQSGVAKRQQRGVRNGRRNSFVSIQYGDENETANDRV